MVYHHLPHTSSDNFHLQERKKPNNLNCIMLMQLCKGFVHAVRFGWEQLWQKLFLKPFSSKMRCLKRKYFYGRKGWSAISKDQQKAIWGSYSMTRPQQ